MDINELNFKEQVLDSLIPVAVDFWADWCMPCKMIEPIVIELQKEYEGKVKIVRLNVDDNQHIAAQYEIMSIPTIAFFVNGQLVDEVVGAVPKKVIEGKLQKYSIKN